MEGRNSGLLTLSLKAKPFPLVLDYLHCDLRAHALALLVGHGATLLYRNALLLSDPLAFKADLELIGTSGQFRLLLDNGLGKCGIEQFENE